MSTTITLTPAIDITVGTLLFDGSGRFDDGQLWYSFSAELIVALGNSRFSGWVDGTVVAAGDSVRAIECDAIDSWVNDSLLDGIHELLGRALYELIGQQVAEQVLAAAVRVWESEVAPTVAR